MNHNCFFLFQMFCWGLLEFVLSASVISWVRVVTQRQSASLMIKWLWVWILWSTEFFFSLYPLSNVSLNRFHAEVLLNSFSWNWMPSCLKQAKIIGSVYLSRTYLRYQYCVSIKAENTKYCLVLDNLNMAQKRLSPKFDAHFHLPSSSFIWASCGWEKEKPRAYKLLHLSGYKRRLRHKWIFDEKLGLNKLCFFPKDKSWMKRWKQLRWKAWRHDKKS